MKSIKYNFTIITILSCMLLSCKKKFEEGPRISLKSANKRIKGDWELQVFSINGIDSTLYYNSVFGEKCLFKIDPPHRYGDEGGITMLWGQDTNKIRIIKLWYDNAKFGSILTDPIRDTLPIYFLYPFCKSWGIEPFDIRYLTDKKLILQIKPNDNYIQRLEFIKI